MRRRLTKALSLVLALFIGLSLNGAAVAAPHEGCDRGAKTSQSTFLSAHAEHPDAQQSVSGMSFCEVCVDECCPDHVCSSGGCGTSAASFMSDAHGFRPNERDRATFYPYPTKVRHLAADLFRPPQI